MSLRINFSRFLLRLGEFFSSLPVVIMKPDDLVEFGRRTYSGKNNLNAFSENGFVSSGLNRDEVELLNKLPSKKGEFLVLGVGGGREVIPISEMGFNVTGVDFVPEMIQRTQKYASDRGVPFKGVIQDFSKIDLPSHEFDVVWLSIRMYSCIPTKKRRIEFVKRVVKILKPGGYFLFQFYWDPNRSSSRIVEFVRKIFAVLTFGNFGYETGDMLWRNAEFLHVFTTEHAVKSEIDLGGLNIIEIITSPTSINGRAICQKL